MRVCWSLAAWWPWHSSSRAVASMDVETHGSQKGSRVAKTACRAAKCGCLRGKAGSTAQGVVGVETLGADIWVSSVEVPWRDHSLLQKLLLAQAACLCFSLGSFPSSLCLVRVQLVLCFLHQHSAYGFRAGGNSLSWNRGCSKKVTKKCEGEELVATISSLKEKKYNN